jgi:hypothetical protein
MTYTGHLIDSLTDLVERAERKPGLNDTCYACGYVYGDHSLYAECPNPRAHEIGQPFYIEGSQFLHWGPQHDAFVTGDRNC